MKVNILILAVLSIFLLSSCANEQPAIPTLKVYVVDESNLEQVEVNKPKKLEKPKVFVIEEENSLAWLQEEKEKREELSKIRILRDFEDKQEEFEFESTYSNVRRVIDSELVRGYIPKIDNPDFKEVDG